MLKRQCNLYAMIQSVGCTPISVRIENERRSNQSKTPRIGDLHEEVIDFFQFQYAVNWTLEVPFLTHSVSP